MTSLLINKNINASSYQSLNPANPYRPLRQSSPIPIGDALAFLADCMELTSIESIVQRCTALALRQAYDLSGEPPELARQCIEWLREDEEEPEFAPLTDIFEKIVQAALGRHSQSVEAFLADVAECYVHATEYLLPVIHHFSKAIATLALDQKRSSISLFLRDAFFFWPPLTACNSSACLPPIHFVRYTRDDQRLGNQPHVMQQVGPGSFRSLEQATFANTLAADVGLYGSLISALIQHGQLPRDAAVLFMVTRNPHLAGWLNFQFGAAMFQGEPVHFPDLVNTADTIESLFKPFAMPVRNGDPTDQPPAIVELPDIVTFCASVAFIQALYRFSRSEWIHARSTVADCLRHLVEAKSRPGSWYMHKPVTPWPSGPEFLKGWTHGFYSPMDNIWCSRF
jgi:hypothetical protein